MPAKNLTILISLATTDQALDQIRQACPHAEIRTGPWIDDEGQNMPTELMTGAHVLLCEIPPANFDDFDQLQWIQLTSAGYSQVLDLPILARNIRVTNGRGNFDAPIAEWNIMMILMWHRHMLEALHNQQHQVWDRSARFQSELRGSVIGLYGYGGIARQTARLAQAMGLEVWALTRDGRAQPRPLIYCLQGTGDPEGVLPDRTFSAAQQQEFFAGLDYLLVGLSLTPATEGIITAKELKMLKPSAVLINPSRAAIIDEQAYIQCLQEKWIRGSSLDVHYAYPLPPEHPLWSMPNLVMTCHISGSAACPYFFERVYDIFSQNISRFCADEPLLNELTESQLRGQ